MGPDADRTHRRAVTPGPLAGVTVLDFSTTFSGPFCTLQLADLGADVVKIEAPGGDITRGLGTSREPGMGSVFLACNRGKSSVVLDLKDESHWEVLDSLLANADALVHNMRPPAAEKLGIGPQRVLEINPRLVHLAITGYDTRGPYGPRPAYDDTVQAMSGLAWLQGLNSGEPTYVASAVVDKVTGMSAAMALIAALYAAERSGVGQAVEVPMFETMVGFNLTEQWGGRAFVPALGDTGYARMRTEYRRPYRTRDGVISVLVYHEGHWRRFLGAIGKGHLLERDEFRTTAARNDNIDALYRMLAEELATRTTAEWLEFFERIDVPVAPVKSLDELFDDEHLEAVEFFHEVGDGTDRYLMARPAFRFSGTPVAEPRDMRLPGRLGGEGSGSRGRPAVS
ncbi:CaiB/BaiF CoA transferase family protein [Mycolicibacterium litorale]|uniref:CaiB/BaiF CoA transferase family protein n=1 Tax=Mycolicibacterium litorale TaxID=758802 RepID=UPI0039A2BCB5